MPRYVTPSGREWEGTPCHYHGDRCVYMSPIGQGSGGGVRGMHVDAERIAKGDKVWKPLDKEDR